MRRMKEQVCPPIEEEDDGFDPNESIEDFRARVGRIIRLMIAEEREDWRQCSHGACRRKRACTLPGGECAVPLPALETTEEEHERFVGGLQRAITKAIAAAEAFRASNPPPPPARRRR